MCVSDDCACTIIGFKDDDPVLDMYPRTFEDDGMGYGVDEHCIVDANVVEQQWINIFIDKEQQTN